jgi:tRNA (cmo5U34)-methyltransferase
MLIFKRMENIMTALIDKSSVEDIKRRFDADVERFTNIETGQTATVDAPLAMELITQAAVRSTPRIPACSVAS